MDFTQFMGFHKVGKQEERALRAQCSISKGRCGDKNLIGRPHPERALN